MDAARQLVRALAGSARAVETQTGISGAQLFVLRQLAAADGPLSVNELAERTLTHQSTVSGVVARLAERRLVSRATASDDARRTEVSLTARGRTLLGDAPATVQTALVAGLARMAPAQRAVLADALESWLCEAGIIATPDGPPLFFEEGAARGGARASSTHAGANAGRAKGSRSSRRARGE
jgi:DNA-binding MarR family transcriptional regulator